MKKVKEKSPPVVRLTGVALAIAAAGMLGACESTGGGGGGSYSPVAEQVDLVHCYGVNSCGGHNDCKSEDNACAGHASCLGSGFVNMPAKACSNIGGEDKGEPGGSISKADLVHCNGANKCSGKNDCKTAGNACAGHGSCKGQGFVAMPTKACSDIGGSVG